MTIVLRSFLSGFVYHSSLSTKKISETHKKKLNSVCTGLVFILALLAVPAPLGFSSTLSCHVAVKPTICDMLLNHEKLGTDTLLPTPPSESREYSLGSPMHTGFVCCFFCVPSEHSVSTHEFGESSWIRWPLPNTDRHDHQKTQFASPGSTFGSPFDSEFWECLKNRCLLLNTDFLGHSLSPSHVPFLPQLVFPASFENVLDFRCLPGCTCLSNVWCTMFLDVSSSVDFPLLRDFWECSLYSLVLLCSLGSNRLFYTSLLTYSTLVLHLLHFPANFLNVLGIAVLWCHHTSFCVHMSIISITSVFSDESPFSFVRCRFIEMKVWYVLLC